MSLTKIGSIGINTGIQLAGVTTVATLHVGSGVNVGVAVSRTSDTKDDVSLLKNAPIPQGSSLEFMGGNKVVLETNDQINVDSDTNNSVDAALTIMEIT